MIGWKWNHIKRLMTLTSNLIEFLFNYISNALNSFWNCLPKTKQTKTFTFHLKIGRVNCELKNKVMNMLTAARTSCNISARQRHNAYANVVNLV
jgi:hypothetical protein